MKFYVGLHNFFHNLYYEWTKGITIWIFSYRESISCYCCYIRFSCFMELPSVNFLFLFSLTVLQTLRNKSFCCTTFRIDIIIRVCSFCMFHFSLNWVLTTFLVVVSAQRPSLTQYFIFITPEHFYFKDIWKNNIRIYHCNGFSIIGREGPWRMWIQGSMYIYTGTAIGTDRASSSILCRLYHRESPVAHFRGGWVYPRTSLDTKE